MTMPELMIRIEKIRRRLHDSNDPVKRLRISRKLDELINEYYRLRTETNAIL